MRGLRSRTGANGRWRVAAACAALALGMAPAVAQGETVARMEVAKEVIKWQPVVEYRTISLVVSSGDVHLRRDFETPEPPYLAAEDKGLGRLPDGTYSYELRVAHAISPRQKKQLAAAREALDQGRSVDLRELGLPKPVPAQSGSFSVRDGAFVVQGEPEPGRLDKQTGDLEIDGSLKVRGTKSFVAADPADAGRELVYAALEGPEAGTYHRGSARTDGGEAVIELPGHFGAVTEAAGLTVQLTPIGGWSRLYVAEKSPRRLVVRSADGEEVEFDYLVQGVRKGYAEYAVERRPADPRAADTEER